MSAAQHRPSLSLLGDFSIEWATEPVPVSTVGQRVLAGLAVLHRGRTVGRTTVAEWLWPDLPPERGTSQLRSVLWRLPRPQGRVLVSTTSTSLRLSSEVAVDLFDGEDVASSLRHPPDHAEPTDRPNLDSRRLPDHDRLNLLTRGLLPSWDEEWLDVPRESYRQQRLHALEAAVTRFLDRSRFSEALTAGLAAVQCDPLRESAHRRVIEVHLAEGNHGEALRQYHRYRTLVVRELGLQPSPAIQGQVAPLLRGRAGTTHRPSA